MNSCVELRCESSPVHDDVDTLVLDFSKPVHESVGQIAVSVLLERTFMCEVKMS